MTNNLSSQIYDNYDKLKNYYKILAIPERGAQSREFNEIQSMLLDLIQRLGDSLFKNGNIVEGCDIRIEGTTVNISPGKVYIDGIVHVTQGGQVTIKGVGDESIGVRLKEELISEVEDTSLLDPAVGAPNYLHPGALRSKLTVLFTVDDNSSATVVKLRNGEIINLITEKPAMDTMSEVLARRTFDESGNYIVRGFEILDPKYHTEDKILVGLSKGKAYIKGFEVQRPTDTTFEIDKAKTTKNVIGEPKVASNTTNTYSLINHPAKAVSRVFITAQKIEQVARGAVSGTMDSLVNTPVVSILEVKQGSTLYAPGKDYLLNNNKIDWSPSGAEPTPGTNYTIKYTYKIALIENTDYIVNQTDTRTTVTIKNGAIVEGSEILIDYEYYLPRKDTVCIDKSGEIIVIKGEPNDMADAFAPVVIDTTILKIGTVTAKPNSNDVLVLNNTVKVSTMERIQNTVNRVNDLEYNIAITNLDKEAMNGEPPTELKGIFTDGFQNFNKIDTTYEGVDFSMDISNGLLKLPFEEFVNTLTPGTFSTNAYQTLGNVYSCPYTEKLVLSQPFCTTAMLVNPYAVFTPAMGVSVDPQVDNWVESSKVTVNQVNLKTANLNKWWLHQGEPWADADRKAWEALGFTGGWHTDDSQGNASNNWLGTASNEHITGTKNETLIDEAILFMRQSTVKITSKTFPFNEDNIQCKFDGRIVPLTPLGTTASGNTPGSVKADSKGFVEASFKVPENVPCGTKEVELYSPNYSGTTSYSASGRKIVTQETIYIERVEVKAVDPLAQTFQLDDTCNILSLDLYFKVKDGSVPAKIQLRGVTNGYPNNVVYGEQVLTGAEIKISEDGSIPTKVTFPNVIKCEKDTQYCIVVMTDSNIMSLHVAKLGERDTVIGQYITSNPYTAGVLFSSSNALTWTAHQDMDMKFNLYRADYSVDGSIQFNSVTPSNADRMMLALEHVRPVGTAIKFEISINNGAWEPYVPWADRELNTSVYKADFKVTMKANSFQSPLISKQTIELISWANKLKACYVSRVINVPEGYKNIKVYLDTAIVAGVTYKVYYTTDAIGSTWTELTNPNVTPLNEYYEKKFYTKDLTDDTNKIYRVKVEMTTPDGYHRPMIKKLMNILKTI